MAFSIAANERCEYRCVVLKADVPGQLPEGLAV
jgi:hypothetical protein